MKTQAYRTALLAIPLSVAAGGASWAAVSDPGLRVVLGVNARGDATPLWLAMLRQRLAPAEYAAVAGLRKALNEPERAWATLIETRAGAWERMIPALAEPFRPVAPPDRALIVLGNRGGNDAFTHDATTIGFDLGALQRSYGDARLAENADRMDRFFRHEYTHLMQKAWRRVHPYAAETPLRRALLDIWAEGLGNWYSLSLRWRRSGEGPSPAAATVLEALEPRFVARLAALACARPDAGERLLADLSFGPFDEKWGALPAALWLEAEADPPAPALRAFVEQGPDGVWDLAARHLPEPLRRVLKEAMLADSLCREG